MLYLYRNIVNNVITLTKGLQKMKINTTEKSVLLHIIDECYNDFFADAESISNACNITIAQAKGYMGSLIKKGLCVDGEVEEYGYQGIHSLNYDACPIGFGCDSYSQEEMLTFYKNKGVL